MLRFGSSEAFSSSSKLIHRSFSSEIFVSRLSHYITETEFSDAFSRFGKIEEARLIRDKRTQRPKGFGFVKFESEMAAEKAIKGMDKRILGGRLIFVEDVNKPKPE
ncbi:hypothetical protein LUZ60_014074 [Juncus effusus]|nr:hypothetical protein LUZ60_014074 [Juncus effusus]